jgi:hypothetical protein
MFLPGLVYVIMLLGRSSLYDQAGQRTTHPDRVGGERL